MIQIKYDFSSLIKKKSGKLKSNFLMNILYFCEKKYTIGQFLCLIVNILYFYIIIKINNEKKINK